MTDEIKLYIFDMDGTLTNVPFKDKAPRAVLPGRKEKLAALKAGGARLAIATNQGGVAFGFTSEEAARAEVKSIMAEPDIDLFRISFGHPKPKWGYEQYGTPEMLSRRKPAPGMLLELIEQAGIEAGECLMVGDMDEDKEAAAAAGCAFIWAKDFFADLGELVGRIYTLFQQAVEKFSAYKLTFYNDGTGCLAWNGWEMTRWDLLEEAPAMLAQELQRVEQEKARAATVPASDDFDPFLDSDDLP